MDSQRLVLALLSALMLAVLFFKGRHSGPDSGVAAFPVVSSSATVQVQIAGEVRFPGVYNLDDNNLTIGAIKMTVPLCPELVYERIKNRAIYVETGSMLSISCKPESADDVVILKPMPAAAAMVLGVPFSLNSASAEELALLPGIGPTLGRRITEYRQKHGGFLRLEELQQVEGIGAKKLESIKKHLKL